MKLNDALKKIDDIIIAVLKWICIALFAALTIILTLNVVIRLLANILIRIMPVVSLPWMDEVVEMLFAALVFYGAAAVWILKGHFSAGDWIGKLLKPPRAKAALRLLVDAISFAFIAIFFRYSINLVAICLERTNVLQLSRKIVYSCMPIGFGIMAIYAVKFMALDIVGIIKPKADQAPPEPEKATE
jgi:TRAP-type C4-dicarboxylate transport system permease small subunit